MIKIFLLLSHATNVNGLELDHACVHAYINHLLQHLTTYINLISKHFFI